MKEHLNKIVGQTAVYSLGNISTKLVGFILLPLYTGYLSTAEFGTFAILEAISQISVAVFTFNLPISMLRWTAAEKDETKVKKIIFNTFIALLTVSVILILAGTSNSSFLSIFFFDTKEFSQYFLFLSIAIGLGVLNSHPLNLLRLREKAKYFAFVSVSKITFMFLMNIYFVAFAKLGVLGIVYSQVLGEILVILLTSYFVVNQMTISLDFHALKEMFYYGFPLIFSTVATMALSLSDRFIIQHYSGESDVGIYTLGYKIAGIINMFFVQSFSLGFLPYAFKIKDQPNVKSFYSKITTYYALVVIFFSFALSIFSKELLELLSQNKDYVIAYTIVPLIAFSFALRGIQFIVSLGFHHTKKTKYIAVIVLASAIVNIVLNFILVPRYGYFSAGITMVFSIIVMIILTYIYSQRLYKILYEKDKIIKLIIITISLLAVSLLINHISIILRILIKLLILAIFIFLVFITKFFTHSEIENIKLFWKKWKNPFLWMDNFKKIKLQ